MGLNDGLGACWKGLMLLSSLLVAGCSDDMSDLHAYIAEVMQRSKGSIQPLPDIRIPETFQFQSDSLRDPFEPDEILEAPVREKVETGIQPDALRPKEELESYELDTLRMVGTVSDQGVLWALLKAADGTIHRVRTGNYLGMNYGKIVGINEREIDLVEIVADSTGAWVERKAAIDLSESGRKP